MAFGGIIWLAVLLTLALFWTAVKAEFRQFATGSGESQNISMPLSERLGLSRREGVLPPARSTGADAAYALISRFAYVDIFGAVIKRAGCRARARVHAAME